MKAALFVLLAAVLAQAAEDPVDLETRVSHQSPNRKYAMQTVHDAGEERSEAIRRIEIVALPSKKPLAQLLPEDDVGTHFEDVTLLWSDDSQWCAFYYAAPRFGYTTVYRLAGGKFVHAHRGLTLRKEAEGDFMEQIEPVRWTREGMLILQQLSVTRVKGEGTVESHWELSAGYDRKTGKFRVRKARELTQEEEEEMRKEIEKNRERSEE
jgi:hypothetical protein